MKKILFKTILVTGVVVYVLAPNAAGQNKIQEYKNKVEYEMNHFFDGLANQMFKI